MPSVAPEYYVIRTYLEWILDLPWMDATIDDLDLKKARNILDNDHYGLDEVKERIIEYLAVRKLKEDTKGQILCFIGPPGVGKTSLGRSIARALGREFSGVRHLLLDIDVGMDRRTARGSAWLTLVASIITLLLMGLWIR